MNGIKNRAKHLALVAGVAAAVIGGSAGSSLLPTWASAWGSTPSAHAQCLPVDGIIPPPIYDGPCESAPSPTPTPVR